MISIVIPVYNEAQSLAQLHAELDRVGREQGLTIELLFVDDGSTDESWSIVLELASRDSRVHGIRLRRNFGKAAALNAGFDAAQGELVFTLDADLQDDPKEIPRFLEQMNNGCDVVSGWKRRRYDPWHKVLPSRVFNWMVSRMTGVQLHDHNCGFKCYRREIFNEVRLYGELHRFIPVLAAARGWRVGELVVEHRARRHGRSKYGLLRIPKGFLDLLTVTFLTGYGQRPQHMLGSIGLISFAFGAMGVLCLTAYWFISRAVPSWEPIELHKRAIFYYSLGATLMGAQLVAIGFLAELLTALNSQQRPPYSIAEQTNSEHTVSEKPDSDARLDPQ